MAEPLPNQAVDADPPIPESEARALREQIRKWQERVPKLATAMRTRSEALVRAQAELRALKRAQRSQQDGDADGSLASYREELEAVRQAAQRDLSSLSKRNTQLFQALQITNHQLEQVGVQMRELLQEIATRDQRVAELESLLTQLEADRQSASSAPRDELTEVRGIGDKLAGQLKLAGFATLADLAALDVRALEDPDHPLHSMRARIRRDAWIDQAMTLSAPS